MSKKNYTNYNKHPFTKQDETKKVDEMVLENVEELDELDEIIDCPKRIDSNKTGVVANCTKLNVRKESSVESDIICVLDSGTEVMIEENKSTDHFYRVILDSGVEGYCMRDFISTK